MRIVAMLRSLWWNLARRDGVEAALDEELRSYVEMLAAENEQKGMNSADARRAALIAVGGLDQLKEVTRDAWLGNAAAVFNRELRYALRSLRRSPAFVVVAIATLGIGIGGATAIFTVINAALFRPLPAVVEPDRLVSLERVSPTTTELLEFSYPYFVDLQRQSKSLAGLAAYDGTSMNFADRAGSARIWVSYVSDNFFEVLGAHPVLGRTLAASAANASASNPPIVIGYPLWQSRYNGDPNVIGSAVKLNGMFFTIVGVAPKGFLGAMRLHAMDVWIPVGGVWQATHGLAEDITKRRVGWLRLVGRLSPGSNAADAQRELSLIAKRLGASYTEDRGRDIRVFTGAGMTDDERVDASRLPRLLAMAVVLLLVIACANVANLSLVRAAARSRELATRLALGASRAALVRERLVEASVLAVGAAVMGILIAQALVHSASIVDTIISMDALDLHPDRRVLGAALLVAAVTAILVSILPALQVSRTRLAVLIKDGSGGAVGRRAHGQRVLVVTQVAASLVLLLCAAMIYGAFQRIITTDPGFEPRGLTTAIVRLRETTFDDATRKQFYRRFLSIAEADPSLAGAAVSSVVPPASWDRPDPIFRRGEEPTPDAFTRREFNARLEAQFSAIVDVVSPRLFEVMRIPLVVGRAFTDHDDEQSPPVVIVNRRLADQLWPKQDPVGQYIVWPTAGASRNPPLQVVGVVGDTRHASLASDPPPVMYVPSSQTPSYDFSLILRGRGNTTPPLETFRRLVASVDPTLAVVGAQTVVDHMAGGLRPQRIAMAWIGVFGVIALVLASIGLYGVVAQGVLQRTRELAVRAALGATPNGLRAMIVGDGMRLAILGTLLGTIGAVGGMRVVRQFLPTVGTFDVAAAMAAVLVLVAAMLVASYVPAHRAAKLNPVDALRCD